jgi:hypothetical protein
MTMNIGAVKRWAQKERLGEVVVLVGNCTNYWNN